MGHLQKGAGGHLLVNAAGHLVNVCPGLDDCTDICVVFSNYDATACGPSAYPCSSNNGSITMTWDAGDSRWEGAGSSMVYYDAGNSRWQCNGTLTATCQPIWYNAAANADCPPTTGWTEDAGQTCTGGNMSLSYGAC